MRKVLLLFVFVCLALVPIGCDDDDDNGEETLGATLTGASEVPPVNTTASGTALFRVNGSTVQFEVRVSNVNAVVASHIHLAAAGSNGPIAVTLFSGPTTGAVNGTLASGTFTASAVSGITFDALIAAMRSGGAYVNVHTVANPAGEVRGQIGPQ